MVMKERNPRFRRMGEAMIAWKIHAPFRKALPREGVVGVGILVGVFLVCLNSVGDGVEVIEMG